jgi:hypothetical protein
MLGSQTLAPRIAYGEEEGPRGTDERAAGHSPLCGRGGRRASTPPWGWAVGGGGTYAIMAQRGVCRACSARARWQPRAVSGKAVSVLCGRTPAGDAGGRSTLRMRVCTLRAPVLSQAATVCARPSVGPQVECRGSTRARVRVRANPWQARGGERQRAAARRALALARSCGRSCRREGQRGRVRAGRPRAPAEGGPACLHARVRAACTRARASVARRGRGGCEM